MTTTKTYRIVKYVDPKTKRDRRVPIDAVEVPAEAFELNEMAQSLKLVLTILRRVKPEHVGSSLQAVRRVTTEIRGWQREAEWQVRSRFLAP
jgi:hypothetical protein